LYAHEAPRAIAEFHRVLRRDGFALITCPDLEAIARLIVAGRFGQAIYPSRAGPIGVADMLWGHAQSIAEGRAHMAHRSGYTVGSLGDLLIAGGFSEAWVQPGVGFDLWAVALREEASPDDARRRLAWGGLHFSQESGDAA
jgi:hypothetical protein